jgi:hypothetical protein
MEKLNQCSVWLQTGLPGFDSRQRQWIIPLSSVSRLALRPIKPPIQWVRGSIPGGKAWLGRDAEHSCPPTAEIKKE